MADGKFGTAINCIDGRTQNPVSKDEHLIQIRKSARIIKSWNLPVEVIAIWVNDQWEVEKVEE